MKQAEIKIELTKDDAKTLYDYLKGKRISSVKEFIVLNSIIELLEDELRN